MTTEAPSALMALPLLMRFATPLGPTAFHRLRYDSTRQIAQVEVNGQWVDTPDAEGEFPPSTLITRVARETTDDQ